MFAVVEIQGQQFKVEENTKYNVPRINQDPDSEITFDRVLIFGDDKKTNVGSPVIDNFFVKAKVLEHIKDDTVVVFKKKRRKGYQKRNGHRQPLTKIEITKIG